MTIEPIETTNLDIYGAPPIAWSRAAVQLEAGEDPPSADGTPAPPRTFWLATSGPDGRPHVAGVGALWLEDRLWFVSGPRTRKSRNLRSNPACAISVRLPGLDLVVEGRARRVSDQETIERVVAAYRAGGWPAEAAGHEITAPYSAPSAGPPPWFLYTVDADVAFGVASAEPHGATRWRFGG
jgi:hypothetical protein